MKRDNCCHDCDNCAKDRNDYLKALVLAIPFGVVCGIFSSLLVRFLLGL